MQAVAAEVVGLREEVRKLFSKQVQEMAHNASDDMTELKVEMREVRKCTDDVKEHLHAVEAKVEGIERELVEIKALANDTENGDWKTELTELGTKVHRGFANQTETYLEVKEELASLQRDVNSTLYLLQDLRSQLVNLRQEVSVDYRNTLAGSCSELHPNSQSGYYMLQGNSSEQVYCDMDRQSCGCGSTRGWMRVADINMTDPNQQCPEGFRLRSGTSKRMCEMTKETAGCFSIVFPTHSVQFSKVCGRVRAYQFGIPEAFLAHHQYSRTIDEVYLDGVSITHGQNPRKHIWSFANARDETRHDNFVCPCTQTTTPYTGTVPTFIGNDYFCDTGSRSVYQFQLYADDPLWDGQGCGPTSSCCQFNSPPWFCKELPQQTSDNIEVRVCRDFHRSDEDILVELIELYVQ